MTLGDVLTRTRSWLAQRTPRQILCAGWIVFVLGCYPGYLSIDAVMQLYSVRTGDYTDYAPVMTALWGALEYVMAGPFPMLVLQSGLALFGAYAIFARVLAPRAAAVTACALVVFPPVFAPLAVIWPDSLMAGALLAGFGALLDERRNWRLAGVVLLGLAVACRRDAALAAIPMVMVVVPSKAWWRRAGIAVGVAVALGAAALVANRALTVKQTYARQQLLEIDDVVGTLRRANLKDNAAIATALSGLTLHEPDKLGERLAAGRDALGAWVFYNGDARLIDPITTDAESDALSAAWRGAISQHFGAYVTHRKTMTKALLGIPTTWSPVFDEFGDRDLLAPLHHRASVSDWQSGMQQIVRGAAATPLFRPWLYVILAIAAVVLARKRRVLRALAASGLIYELALIVCTPVADFRYSHWLVTAACAACAALAVARKARWAREA
jgi:hypothetical protein